MSTGDILAVLTDLVPGAVVAGPLLPEHVVQVKGAENAMKYKVVLKRSDEGYSISCPGLPGCWSQGDTESEALANVADAIREYQAVRDELLKEGEIREVEVVN